MENLFSWLGETLGHMIRFVVDTLGAMFSGIDDAAAGFANGLSGSLGISPSLFSMAFLALGIFFLYRAVRALIRGAVIAAILWALFALVVLGTLLP